MPRMNSHEVPIAILNDETLKDRFFRFFERGKPDDCWIWKGAVKNVPGQNYGLICTKRVDNKPGKMVYANRVSLFFETHLLPLDRIACHKCHNPSCVNPKHLYWGTDADNSRDMTEAGRHHQQILTENGRIPNRDYSKNARKPNRRLYKDRELKLIIKKEALAANQKELVVLSEKHNMSFGMLVAIKYGRTWKDVVI